MRIESREDLKTWASFKNISVYLDQKKILSNININIFIIDNIIVNLYYLDIML